MTAGPEPNVDALVVKVSEAFLYAQGRDVAGWEGHLPDWTVADIFDARLSELAALARANTARDTLLHDAMVALEAAEKEASIAHDAIWSKEVASAGILHDNDREGSASAAIWRLHEAVRPLLARFAALNTQADDA